MENHRPMYLRIEANGNNRCDCVPLLIRRNPSILNDRLGGMQSIKLYIDDQGISHVVAELTNIEFDLKNVRDQNSNLYNVKYNRFSRIGGSKITIEDDKGNDVTRLYEGIEFYADVNGISRVKLNPIEEVEEEINNEKCTHSEGFYVDFLNRKCNKCHVTI
jgi:hypothetical protein